jgi:hypothetical protein
VIGEVMVLLGIEDLKETVVWVSSRVSLSYLIYFIKNKDRIHGISLNEFLNEYSWLGIDVGSSVTLEEVGISYSSE